MTTGVSHRAWAAAGLLFATLSSGLAMADTTDQDKALALHLFDEGRSLLAAGKVDDACRKLEESRRLDPLPGTILNVAVCHEQQGRTATAVAELREARALAERDHRDDRVALADQHLRALEGKVSVLVIVVAPAADRPDLVITNDATPVGRAAWGARIPVDPGPHTVVALAADKKPWKVVVTVGAGGDVQTAAVLPLEDAAPPASVAPPPSSPPAPARAATPEPAPESRAGSHGLSTRRTVALVTAGVGLVGVGVGSYFGLTAISKHHDPAATCTVEPCTNAIALNNDAKAAADASSIAFAVGLAALGAGAILWISDSGGGDRKAAAVQVTPSVGWGRAGVDVGGGF